MKGLMEINFPGMLSCIMTTIEDKVYHCGQYVKNMQNVICVLSCSEDFMFRYVLVSLMPV